MTDSKIRAHWLAIHNRLSKEAEVSRNSQMVAFGLLEAYDALSPKELSVIHSILAEWLIDDDNRLRYDARFLTSQRQLHELKTSVREAIAKYESEAGPEASNEVKHLERILIELE